MAESKTLEPKTESKETLVAKNSLPVHDQEGNVVSQFALDASFFDKKVNERLLAHMVRVYQANQHQGTHSVKTRGEVRGGGRKPWKQKGTGRARTGSIRGAQWRGGGIIFGPVPSDPGLKLNKKMKSRALFEALKMKIQNQSLVLINGLVFNAIKTKDAARLLKALPVNGKTLVLGTERNDIYLKSFRNLENVKMEEARNLSPYDVLYYNSVLMTEAAFRSTVEKVVTKKGEAV